MWSIQKIPHTVQRQLPRPSLPLIVHDTSERKKKKFKMCLDLKLYLCNFLEKETKASMKGISRLPLLLILKQRAGVQG